MKGIKKVMITSDYHIPYMDGKAYSAMKSYAKAYKPNHFVINGDFLDFYSVSKFDRSPERKESVQIEVDQGNRILDDIVDMLPKGCKMYYLEGNHETRLKNYLWRNPELYGMDALKIENLLQLKRRGIKFIGSDPDYWKNDNGHLEMGDMLIMHGDNRLNGASTSKYAGYSSKNTVVTMMSSIAMGHVHRLALNYLRTPKGNLVGMEVGMLAQHTGTANWAQGFGTFELYRGKSQNHRIHQINNGKLYVDGTLYK